MIVVQEWWGLVPQIQQVCDQFAAEGFVALAPDLYHGDIAEHTEIDKASHLMTTLPIDRAATRHDRRGRLPDRARRGARRQGRRRRLLHGRHARPRARGAGRRQDRRRPRRTTARRSATSAPDWSNLTAPVRGHFAGDDDFFPAEAVQALEQSCRAWARTSCSRCTKARGHAFTNDADVFGTYDDDLSAETWAKTVTFLHDKLG